MAKFTNVSLKSIIFSNIFTEFVGIIAGNSRSLPEDLVSEFLKFPEENLPNLAEQN